MMQCSISECREEAEHTVEIGPKETRNLCERHHELFMNRKKKHRAAFARASEI